MEIASRFSEEEEEQIELPPGFRFHPTDEELITHYLSPKVLDNGFQAQAIGEVELNKCEPWELPWKAKMGEKEWYFFYLRDRKYPTGLRTNRATNAGYWKATGKDKEIHRRKTLVGMKKTLVFYKGRAPKGIRTDWVMHEYQLEGNLSSLKADKLQNEWVICRVFEKSAGGKRIHIPDSLRVPSELSSLPLPPLMVSSPHCTGTRLTEAAGATTASHVTSFSEPMSDLTRQEDSNLSHIYMENLQISDHYGYGHGLGHHEQSLLRTLLDNYDQNSTGALDYNDPFWQ